MISSNKLNGIFIFILFTKIIYSFHPLLILDRLSLIKYHQMLLNIVSCYNRKINSCPTNQLVYFLFSIHLNLAITKKKKFRSLIFKRMHLFILKHFRKENIIKQCVIEWNENKILTLPNFSHILSSLPLSWLWFRFMSMKKKNISNVVQEMQVMLRWYSKNNKNKEV